MEYIIIIPTHLDVPMFVVKKTKISYPEKIYGDNYVITMSHSSDQELLEYMKNGEKATDIEINSIIRFIENDELIGFVFDEKNRVNRVVFI